LESSGKFWKSSPIAAPYKAPAVHGLVLNELKSPAARGGHLHLVFDPHIVLDHLPGHPHVVGDLVDIVALSVPGQDAGAAQPVNGRVLRLFRVDVPVVLRDYLGQPLLSFRAEFLALRGLKAWEIDPSKRVWRCLGSQQTADAAGALTSDKTHP
jgi:hypothetical protein